MKIPEQEKAVILHKFVSKTLLVPIVQLNQDRLVSLIQNRVGSIKETWSSIRLALEDETIPTDTAVRTMKLHQSRMNAWVKNISNVAETTDMQNHYLELCIEESWNILDRALTLPKNLEKLCEKMEGQTSIEENGTPDIWEDECNSEADLQLGSTKVLETPPRSSILKVMLALARYVSAGKCIVEWAYQSLQTLDQSGMTGNFKVSPVVGFDGENESFRSVGIYRDLQEAFLALEYRLPDTQMINELDVQWKNKLSYNLYVHAETQLTLFYVCNPHLCSGDIFIGTSKKLCIACTMMIEYLNKSFRKCRFMRGVRLVYKDAVHRRIVRGCSQGSPEC
ncbi:hypothetical protein BDQ17DRAFT_413535 [Cyathus striatus]|nr:hypothetical protein BDQ17DRAFT_413535 [Cyathus striatus]